MSSAVSLPYTEIARPEWVATQDPAYWLSDEELDILEGWASPIRRAEWLAGRLAVKRLLYRALWTAPRTCTVGHEGVAPYIHGLERPELTFSLSHSACLGAATFSVKDDEGSAGIDVQHVRPVHPGLCARVFSPTEQAQIAGRFGAKDNAEGMLLFWALKEAAIKARRQAWGKPLVSIEVRLTGNDSAIVEMPGEPPLTSRYEWLDGWWLARAVLKVPNTP